MIIFTGPPGSGKSTQAELLAKHLNCPKLSIGEELRKQTTDEQAEQTLDNGGLVPSSLVTKIVEDYLAKHGTDEEVVVDGSLRKPDEARWLIEAVAAGKARLTAVINLNLPDIDAKNRLLPRGRKDDQPQTIERRLSLFHKNQLEILDLLSKNELPVINIEASGNPLQIFDSVKKALKI